MHSLFPDSHHTNHHHSFKARLRSGVIHQAPLGLLPSPSSTPLLSVILPVHNAAPSLTDSISSILEQRFPNLELLVIDATTTDRTRQLLSDLREHDSRIRPYHCSLDRGDAWNRNLGLLHAWGTYVTFQHEDALSDPDRLQAQLDALSRCPAALVSTTDSSPLTPSVRTSPPPSSPYSPPFATLLFHRQAVLARLGYFDPASPNPEADYWQRLRTRLPDSTFTHIHHPFYLLPPDHPLLRHSPSSPSPTPSASGHPSFQASSNLPPTSTANPHKPLPPDSFLPFPSPSHEPITASLASIPQRVNGLRHVINTVLPQVDHLHVYLNDYPQIPSFLNSPQITVWRSQNHGPHRDNGKFFPLTKIQAGYFLTLDDDISYPPDYVARHLTAIEQYDRQAITGFHGILFPSLITRYFDPRSRRVFPFHRALSHHSQVHALGTGTVALHLSTLPLQFKDFKTPGMADLWLAAAAQTQQVPLIALSRPDGLLQDLPQPGPTLYHEYKNRDQQQTHLARLHAPWTLPPLRSPHTKSPPPIPHRTTSISPPKTPSPKPPLFIKIYGLQRSGTNWIRFLLEKNLPGVFVVDRPLGSKHNPPAPWTGLYDFLHDQDATPFGPQDLPYNIDTLRHSLKAFNVRAVILTKPLLAWIWSYFNFRRMKSPEAVPQLTPDMACSFASLWLTRNAQFLHLNQGHFPLSYLVNYVHLLEHTEKAIDDLSSTLILPPPRRPLLLSDQVMTRGSDHIKADQLRTQSQFRSDIYRDRTYLKDLPKDVTQSVADWVRAQDIPRPLTHLAYADLDMDRDLDADGRGPVNTNS